MMLEINRKRPREYSNNWSKSTDHHSNVFANSNNENNSSNLQMATNNFANSSNYHLNTAKQALETQQDIIVLDSDANDEDFSFTNNNNDNDPNAVLIDDYDNDSDIVILEERKLDEFDNNDIIDDDINDVDDQSYESKLSSQFNKSFFDSDFSLDLDSTTSFNINGSIGLRPFKKPRTKSLPQLPHSRISYHPPPNLHQLVTTKVGEIKTNFVPFNESNYTFISPPSSSSNTTTTHTTATANARRISFSGLGSHTKDSNRSESICDDNDGHYIVKPGEFFANGRFRIKKLLGQGTFGKVINAYDTHTNEVVAIKIIRAVPKYREASKIELRVLSTIKKHDPNNQNHCIHLRECFDYRSHICIVTDLLKISLFDFLEKNNFKPFPGSHIQAIAKQLIRSVAFLHDLKLIHTDLKPENILLHNDSYIRKPYKTIKGKPTTTRVLKDPLIQIIDFGSAIFDDEYHSQVVSTRHYRAPEIVLNIGWSFPCDMWSVGCILVELATGEALFRTHENLEHLAMMEKVIGRSIDTNLVKKCFNNNRSYGGQDDSNNVIHCFDRSTGALLFPSKASSDKSVKLVDSMSSIDELISSKVGLQIDTNMSLEENYIINENASRTQYDNSSSSFNDDNDSDDSDHDDRDLDRDVLKFWFNFIDLIKRCLIYNPQKRLKAIDAMEHPWFDLGIYDDGTKS